MAKLPKYAIQLLDEFEKRSDNWKCGDFENRLRELKSDATYQNAKAIIVDAHELGKWPKTVEQYVRTSFDSLGQLPSELNSVSRKLYEKFSPEKKKEWDELAKKE